MILDLKMRIKVQVKRWGFTSLLLLSSISAYTQESHIIQTIQKTSNAEYQAYAVLVPLKEAQLSSEMTGVISSIRYLPGEAFSKGDALVTFNCKDIEIEIKRATAETKSTQAVKESTIQLQKLNSISTVDATKAHSEHDKALAELEKYQHQFTKCTILAPYDGEVVAKEANVNETVKMDDPLIHIVNNKNLEVQMYIPSLWLQQLALKTPFTLNLQELVGTEIIKGNITKIVGRIDPASQSVLIFGKLDENNYKLFAGMSGVASFKTLSKKKAAQ